MDELARLKQIIVVKAVAVALEKPAIGGQDEHLLAWAIFASLPEGLVFVGHNKILLLSIMTT